MVGIPGATGRRGRSVACDVVTATRTLPVVMALLLVLGACSVGDDSAADTATATASRDSAERGTAGTDDHGSLDWSACAEELASMAGLECASLPVPLDPTDPEGEEIDLAVARSTSTGEESERIGSLVLNPGGPGGSGIEFLAGAASSFPEALTDRFDLVSFDPRGVGQSSPVRCLDDDAKDEQLEGDLSPDTPAEVDSAIEDVQEQLAACERNAGEMLAHMSTADVAADLDELRQALGDEQLSYLGYSYGSEIGAAYATLFPERSRALVLDGSVSPDATDEQELTAQARGFDRTYASFVETCDADPECPLGPDTAATMQRIRDELEQSPIEVSDESGTRELSRDLFDLGVATALYDTSLWSALSNAVANLSDGGAEVLLSLVDRQTGRQPDGSYDNSSDAQIMVSCADTDERPGVDEALAAAERIAAAAPTFGELTAFGTLTCVGWPEPANPLPTPTGEGAPPVLVVGTVGDPATPYEWSVQMSEALQSGVLLTYEGDGHTAFLRGGECIDDAVVDYLVDLVVPDEGTRCPAVEDESGLTSLRDELIAQLSELGTPERLAECVVDGAIEEVGEEEFERLVLGNDQQEITRLFSAQALRCAAGGS